MPVSQPQGTLQAGEVLNSTYVIESLIAFGGTGEVYRARNKVTGRELAIKILRREYAADEAFINLMRREAAVLHEVNDDAVVRYHDLLSSDAHGGFVFLVMEFIEGQPLSDIVKQQGAVSPQDLLVIADRIGGGLKAAHEKNAYHRDISPDNILLRGGQPARAVLIDFGIARDMNENAQTVVGGGFAGKYQYASPEQMDGNVDSRSDIYSLGMTLIHAFRGKSTKVGTSLLEIVKAKAERPDISDIPGKLGQLIARMVEPRPEDRFQSAAEMLAFLRGTDTGIAPGTAPGPDDGLPAGLVMGGDATVVMPRQGTQTPGMSPSTAPGSTAPAPARVTLPPEPEHKRGGGKWALILVLLATLGGGAWFFGLGPGRDILFGSSYPLAEPYRLTISSSGDGAPVRVSGNIPSPEAGTELDSALARIFDGSEVQSVYRPATGAPYDNFGPRVREMALSARALAQWQLEFSDRTVTLSGEAEDQAEYQQALANATAAAAAMGFDLIEQIEIKGTPVSLENLNAALEPYWTCGPLEVTGGDGGIVPPGGSLTVTGIIARDADREVLGHVIDEIAPGRQAVFNLLVLNAPVCRIDALLPLRNSPDPQLVFGYGDRPGTARDGIYRIEENPVIDLTLPADAEGYVHVFYVDFQGQVFHFLPHNNRQDNDLASIGEVEGDLRSIRLTWPVSQASTAQLGFRVVEPLGTNMIVAIVTPEPLFEQIRPRAEPASAFAEALAQLAPRLTAPDAQITRRYLVTER